MNTNEVRESFHEMLRTVSELWGLANDPIIRNKLESLSKQIYELLDSLDKDDGDQGSDLLKFWLIGGKLVNELIEIAESLNVFTVKTKVI